VDPSRGPHPKPDRSEGFVQTSGLQIYYVRWGAAPRGGRPLVVLHGGPGASHDILVPGFGPLAAGREVIFYDQRGCGRSRRLTDETPCTLADNVADLEVLRRELGLGRIDLAGHSWGGLLAMAYALDRGRRVRKLVLITPALPYLPNPSWSEFLGRLPLEKLEDIERVRRSERRSGSAKAAALWRITVPEFFHRKAVLEGMGLERMPYSPEAAGRLADDLFGLDLRPRLRRLRIPTLIVAGRFDPRLALKHQEALADLLPQADLAVMEASGHFPFLEEPEAFIRTVEAFLG